MSNSIAEKWFTLPNAIGLLPTPLSSTVAYLVVFWVLRRPDVAKAGYAWLVYGWYGGDLRYVLYRTGVQYLSVYSA